MEKLTKKGGQQWYYASYTFEADPEYHKHTEVCEPKEVVQVLKDSFGTERTVRHTPYGKTCGYDGLQWLKFVIFADSGQEAVDKGEAYAKAHIPQGFKRYSKGQWGHLYLRNYIRESQNLVDAGLYTGNGKDWGEKIVEALNKGVKE